MAFQPFGILVVKLLSAEGLLNADKGDFFTGSSDPYAKIRLGTICHQTKVVTNSTNPSWFEEMPFLIDDLVGHEIKVKFFDQDTFTPDDYLGSIRINTEEIKENEITDFDISTKGKAQFEFRFLPIVNEQFKMVKYFVYDIFVFSFNNVTLENGEYPDCYAEVQVGNQVKKSQICLNDPHPRFNRSFIFLVKDQMEKTITIKLIGEQSKQLGCINLQAENLVKVPLKRKLLSLNPENPFTTALISAKISFG